MKKISILLSIIMVFCVISVYAEENLPTIFSDVTKTEGNTVEVILSISEGSNIAGCSFNIVYDSEKLTYTSHEVGTVISSMMNLVNPNYNANAIRVLWADMKELTVGGEIVKIVFTINDGALGSTDIIIDKLIMMDVSSMPVDCSCENKTIRLSNSEENDEVVEDEPIVDVPVEDDKTEDDSSDSNNISSGNGNSGNSSSSNRPSSSITNLGGSASTKEPIKDDNKEPVVEDEEDIANDTENEVEKDYEIFLLGFDDVKETDWFYESVKFVKERQYMSGVSDTEFAPNSNLTRGMLVTILYRLEDSPECEKSPFSDVGDNEWYSKGVSWAAEKGIVNGVGEGLFAPNSNITREQIAVILYNYSKLHELDITHYDDLDKFNDVLEISSWANDAMHWAVGANLLNGKGEGVLDPKGNATRAELATILKRFTENM